MKMVEKFSPVFNRDSSPVVSEGSEVSPFLHQVIMVITTGNGMALLLL